MRNRGKNNKSSLKNRRIKRNNPPIFYTRNEQNTVSTVRKAKLKAEKSAR